MAAQNKLRHHTGYRLALYIFITLFVLASVLLISYFNHSSTTSAPEMKEGEIEIHMVDVGQGDCILILSDAGNIIIDTGTSDAESALRQYLKNNSARSFEYAIFTHPHEDHIGGADMVVNEFDVKNIIMPDVTQSTATYDRLLSAIEDSDATVHRALSGDTYNIGEIKLTVLAPNSDTYSEINNYSVVLRLDYKNTSFIFTGDAESLSESEILAKYSADMLDCDVLKIGHHGSSGASSEAFLEALTPEIALISCGKDNTYGHPNIQTIERLENIGATVYRTDKLGNVILRTNGTEIKLVES